MGNLPRPKSTLSIKTIVAGPLRTNTYLITSGNQALVVDPGVGATRQVCALAESTDCEIVTIVNTHGHWDHAADNAELMRGTGAPLYVHEQDADMVRSPSTSLDLPFDLEPANPTSLMRDGEVITLNECELRIVHTPGHTPGSVCLLVESERMIITGDTLFRGTYGRFDLAGGNEQDLYRSLQVLRQLDSGYLVYPGHGPTTTISSERAWLSQL